MRRRRVFARPRLATACAALAALLLLAGALFWYRPALTAPTQPFAEIPAPPAMFVASRFAIPGHQQACMQNVTVTPRSQLVSFQIFPAAHAKGGGPPVAFTVEGAGYQTKTMLKGGYPGGNAMLSLTPPKRALIATACFHNLGARPVFLVGSDEARSISRSHPVAIGGRAVAGDIAFSFLENQAKSPLQLLGQLVAHASNLTDGLLPPALIWVIVFLTALGVPAMMILALWSALRDSPLPTDAARDSRPRTAPSG